MSNHLFCIPQSTYLANTSHYILASSEECTCCGDTPCVTTTMAPEQGLSPNNPFIPQREANVFRFPRIPVPRRQTRFFDPEVTIGYDFIVDDGPSIYSVVLPPNINQPNDPFHIWLGNSSCSEFTDVNLHLNAGEEYIFSSPVPCFGVRNIDPNANLDPTNPLAFVTGLSFDTAGSVDLRQIPLVSTTAAPTTTAVPTTTTTQPPAILSIANENLISINNNQLIYIN